MGWRGEGGSGEANKGRGDGRLRRGGGKGEEELEGGGGGEKGGIGLSGGRTIGDRERTAGGRDK